MNKKTIISHIIALALGGVLIFFLVPRPTQIVKQIEFQVKEVIVESKKNDLKKDTKTIITENKDGSKITTIEEKLSEVSQNETVHNKDSNYKEISKINYKSKNAISLGISSKMFSQLEYERKEGILFSRISVGKHLIDSGYDFNALIGIKIDF